jgi:hypothetical protein
MRFKALWNPRTVETVRKWAPIAISLVALLVSGWALHISRSAFETEAIYKELSLLPVLELNTKFDDGIKITVKNNGVGPAVIHQIKVGNVSVAKYLYAMYGDQLVDRAGRCAKTVAPKYSSYFRTMPIAGPHYIRAGDSFEVFAIQFYDESEKVVKFTQSEAVNFFECVDETNIHICYCSISDRTCRTLVSKEFIDSDFVCPRPR